MKLKVENTNLFKAIFRGITRFTDIAHFEANNNGIRIKSLDPHDFCYVDIKLSPSFFEQFSWDSEKLSSGADIGKFRGVIQTITKEIPLSLDINKKNISLNLVNGSVTRYVLDWLPDDYSLPEPLSLDYDSYVTLPAGEFFNIIKEAAAVSREICFSIENHRFKVYATNGDFSYSKELTLSNDLSKNMVIKTKKSIKVWVIIDYLRTLSEIINLCGQVKLCLKEDLPLKLDLSYEKKGIFTFIISNRKLTPQQKTIRSKKLTKKNHPSFQDKSLPNISVTKFPMFLELLNKNEGVVAADVKHSVYESLDGAYTRLGTLLHFIEKKSNRFYLTNEGKGFVRIFKKSKRSSQNKLHKHLKNIIPEYSQILDYVSTGPMSAEDLAERFFSQKKKNSMITKKDDVLLLLGIATWCNAIDRKLGLYYFGK